MSLRRLALRATRGLGVGAVVLSLAAVGARADMLRATYSVSLIGLPIGVANVNATLTPNSYAIDATAKLSGLATMISRSRGASTGHGAIVDNHVVPATFATTASNASMTRTIRMSLAANAVTGVDISPPFEDKPDRVPLSDRDKQGIVDPVGAFVIPAPAKGPLVGPASCDRTIPDLRRLYALRRRSDLCRAARSFGQGLQRARWRSAPCATCRSPAIGAIVPATKFMADNKDLEVWLAPIDGARVLMPFRVSVRTMIGTTVIEASEFSVAAK